MLKVEHLYKKLGDFQLRDVNLEINDGEYFVILGPSGTGKSVILDVIAGLIKPDSGNIIYNGENCNKLPPENRELGFIYQDYLLFPHLNIKENIIFGLKSRKFSKREIDKKLMDMCEMFSIEHLLYRKPKTLSGGEQQRVAIARALITSPKIVLLDEPLSALDPCTKKKFMGILKRLNKETGAIFVHITHDFNEAKCLADKIAVIKDGSVVQIGNPKNIFEKPNSTFVAEFVGIENIFKGEVKENKIFITKDFHFEPDSTIELEKETALAIRPENIKIFKNDDFNKYKKNEYIGIISSLSCEGPLCKIIVDIGVKLIVTTAAEIFWKMNISIGDRVNVFLESSAVHLISCA